MNKQALIDKLNRHDVNGVGCVVMWSDGNKTYNFYEDFENDNGINRAARQFQYLIDAGKVRRVDYIYKDHTTVHFWDWDTKSDQFCANYEFIRFAKAHNLDYFYDFDAFIAIIDGIKYKFDYTPAVDGISAIKTIRR